MVSNWSPSQYLKFEDYRTRPSIDLLAHVPFGSPSRVTDLGCGPGNSTELLAARYPDADIRGMDSSLEMVSSARKRLPDRQFEVASVENWKPERPQDVIFANAVLQWVPDHRGLLPRLAACLAPGGSLAIQMPDNLAEPTHSSMREAAGDLRWATKLETAHGERTTIEAAVEYYRILSPHCSRVDVWRTTYHHPLNGLDGIVEWFKGTGLLPYLTPLDAGERAEYLSVYRGLLARHYPVLPDGKVILPFPRLFIVATR